MPRNSGRFQAVDHCSVIIEADSSEMPTSRMTVEWGPLGPRRFLLCGGELVEGLKRLLKAGTHQAPGDKYEAGACNSIRPGVEMGWRMDRMLDTVNDHRRRNTPNVQHAFHAKNILPVTVQQHGQPQGEGRPVERRIQ